MQQPTEQDRAAQLQLITAVKFNERKRHFINHYKKMTRQGKRTYSDNNYEYDVDMILACFNKRRYMPSLNLPNVSAIPVKSLRSLVTEPCWGKNADGKSYGPREVLNYISGNQLVNGVVTKILPGEISPSVAKEYNEHILRINNCDMSYPIIVINTVCSYHVIDGMHRLTHAILNGRETINAYIISKELLEMYIIAERNHSIDISRDHITSRFDKFLLEGIY